MTKPAPKGWKQPHSPLTPVRRKDPSEPLQPPQQPPQEVHLPPLQQVLREWLLASEQVPKLPSKTTTWKQVFSATASYRTFIMKYGFRVIPTDRALAGCPPPPPCPPRGRGSSLPASLWLQRAVLPASLPGARGVGSCPSWCLRERHTRLFTAEQGLAYFSGC